LSKISSIKINNIYGCWKVLETSESSYVQPKILCECIICCKVQKYIHYSKLLKSQLKSCGCQQFKRSIKIGDQFTHLTVSSLQFDNAQRILCKCICGLEKPIDYRSLLNKVTNSCGCQTTKLRENSTLKIYGVKNASQSTFIRKKIESTSLERLGVRNPSQSELIKQKKVITLQQNYGDSYVSSSQVPEIKMKIEQTNLHRYGAKSPLESSIIQEKIIQTNLHKYGTKYQLSRPEVHKKSKETNLTNYGVENLTQLPQNRNRLKIWCEENPEKLHSSKDELELLLWLQKHYSGAKKFRKQQNELDIYIPELKLGIEYNGLYWHSESVREKNYHLDKTKYFKDQEIRTIHIWSSDWQSRQDQVKSFLLSAINKNEHKIGARKCKVVWSDSKEEIKKAHDLLDSTHIQGHTNSTKYAANVYCNNELLATATFGKHHRNSKTWVLSRFTTKTNYTIQGILSKISKLASKELKSDIVSWADYRLSTGNGYEKAGWKFEELLKPDYFYMKSGSDKKVISKQSRQKKLVNTPKDITEHQHALQDGLLRVYDCGKIRYKYPYILI